MEIKARGQAQDDFTHGDLAPVPEAERRWRLGSFTALWISLSACIPSYMLASSLLAGGMNWWQALLTITLGNTLVLIPMILNAHAGAAYGIPFPVYCRAAFGAKGANVPSLLRAFVGCGWFGIQTWIGGECVYRILVVVAPVWASGGNPALGITLPHFLCFLFFWSLNICVVFQGMPCIRWLLIIKAPVVVVLSLVLLVWACRTAGGLGPVFSQPPAFDAGQSKAGQFWGYFFPALTGMIGFWATLSLNIPDFSRYAKSQGAQAIGQTLGLPFGMAFFSFIGVAIASATQTIHGASIWDPVEVLARFENPVVVVVGMLTLCLATLVTNIAANLVGPSNSFAHLAPDKISFRLGGLMTGIIGVLMMPWKLVAEPDGFIFTWLIAYSALLGPIGGILIADYYVCRGRKLNLDALYRGDGEYRFTNGYGVAALLSLVAGVLPSLPGFLVQVKLVGEKSVPDFAIDLYHYAWFVGFALGFAVYLVLRKLAPRA